MGKSVRLFLANDDPRDLITIEVGQWTGLVVVAPRTSLNELCQRPETARTGVYCLVGQDPEKPSKDRVYIGETDDVSKRLRQHSKSESKDFWTRCVVAVSKDTNLTKAHARFLESRLIELAIKSGRAVVDNSTAPVPPQLPEPDVADMERYLGELNSLLPLVGLNFTRPTSVLPEASGTWEPPVFTFERVGATARARAIGDELVVLKGSTARIAVTPSWTSYRALRDQLVEEGRLVPKNSEYYEFAEDIVFASPSAAAAVVRAGNTNGRVGWKLPDGTTYGDWYENRPVN